MTGGDGRWEEDGRDVGWSVRVVADEDEGEERSREGPLVGALLEDDHVQQHGELRERGEGRGEERREVRGER